MPGDQSRKPPGSIPGGCREHHTPAKSRSNGSSGSGMLVGNWPLKGAVGSRTNGQDGDLQSKAVLLLRHDWMKSSSGLIRHGHVSGGEYGADPVLGSAPLSFT